MADLCLACSGSVSLELLFHRKPTVIVYKVSRLVMFLQSIFLRCKYITLVNLIACHDIKRKAVRVYRPEKPGAEPAAMPEFLTRVDCPERLARALNDWLREPRLLEEKRQELNTIAQRYVQPGATERAADYLMTVIDPKTEMKGTSAA